MSIEENNECIICIDSIIEENNECLICFDPINDNNQNTQILKDCEHNNCYHHECMNDWIKESINKNLIPSCPICRKQIKLTEIFLSLTF